ncbi:hypothetical protein GCM10022240_14950 [Microbacterium kribbense]|uniref:Uncharacterized protein n=2 Tax=Microbacterium kribbense TaxID=433645 RepID=A0ABP7GGP9_9MICO
MAGAAPFMHFSAWTTLGGFREDLFLYWEDSALSIAAQEIGLKMAVLTSAHVWHSVGGSSATTNTLSAIYYYYNQRNRLLTAIEQRRVRALLIGPGVFETIKQLIRPLRIEKEDRWVKFRAGVLGLLDGLRGRSGKNHEISGP